MPGKPHCAFCGTPIRKWTTIVYLEHERSPLHKDTTYSRHVYPNELGIPWPQNMTDCRKLTNQTVTSIKRGAVWRDQDNGAGGHVVRGELVRSFNEWDGVRYHPSFTYFCSTLHAAQHGQLAAGRGMVTDLYKRGKQHHAR